MPKTPFDDELTPEEEALLNDPNAIPPAEDEGEGTVEQAVAEAEADKTPAKEEPKPAAEQQPAGEQQPTEQQPNQAEQEAEDRAFAEFLEKNKGKSAEELARIAFQQQKRANREAQTNRQTREAVSQLAERARAAAERRNQVHSSIGELKQQFREKLSTDPDAAVAELFDRLADRDAQVADVEATAAQMDAAIEFADTHIPEFGKQWPGMKSLANELGYKDEELDVITDGRALIVLSLANHTARLMKAGLMDNRGNLINVPAVEAQPVDPRLAAPAPQPTLGGKGAGAKTSRTVAEQLAEISAMSDAELDAFEKANPGVLENLLRQAA